MKPRRKVGTAKMPDGAMLELFEHDGNYVLLLNGEVLMSTRNQGSEEDLARLGCRDLPEEACVLIGGLGMGFTLRTTLDLLSPKARVVQAELVPEVVTWNQGPLGDHAGRPCDDPRTEIVVDDVGAVIRRSKKRFDAILLDVDNGPSAMVARENSRLYSEKGLLAAHTALKPGGCLAIWSASHDVRWIKRFEGAGFAASTHRVSGRSEKRGPQYVIFVGYRQ